MCEVAGLSPDQAASEFLESLDDARAERAVFDRLFPDRDSKDRALPDLVTTKVRRIENLPQTGGSALVACARVGTVEFMPTQERCELTECTRCGASLWITSRIKEAIEKKGMTINAICIGGCPPNPKGAA
jgi:hypothetical protein